MLKKIIVIAITIAGWITSIYVGLYKMIIHPIMNLCAAIYAGNVSAVLIVKTILCFIFAFIIFKLIEWNINICRSVDSN